MLFITSSHLFIYIYRQAEQLLQRLSRAKTPSIRATTRTRAPPPPHHPHPQPSRQAQLRQQREHPRLLPRTTLQHTATLCITLQHTAHTMRPFCLLAHCHHHTHILHAHAHIHTHTHTHTALLMCSHLRCTHISGSC